VTQPNDQVATEAPATSHTEGHAEVRVREQRTFEAIRVMR